MRQLDYFLYNNKIYIYKYSRPNPIGEEHYFFICLKTNQIRKITNIYRFLEFSTFIGNNLGFNSKTIQALYMDSNRDNLE